MEERIIDDEYGRGIRLKKTKDGYVDVTDELTPETEDETVQDADEIAFEFPVLETEDDEEELATLSPEEAIALIRRREEEAKARAAEYEKTCQEGDELLESSSFHAAELKFEKALGLDELATKATVGYWRAKTENFTNPDALIDEYAFEGIDSLEHDLGLQAVDIIKAEYKDVFSARIAQLEEEQAPLEKTVEEKRAKRAEILSKRLIKSSIIAAVCALPAIALLVLSIFFGLKNFTTPGDEYVTVTIVLLSAFFVALIVCAITTNKWLNVLRMRRKNKKLTSTEEGKRLSQIRAYKTLYAQLLPKTQD